MELDVLKTTWQFNNERLERTLRLNEKNIELIQTQKVTSKLAPLYRQRVIECIFHAIAIALLSVFLVSNISELPYAVSAAALLCFYVTTFVNAIKQINLIRNLDFNSNLATMQSSLVLLQTHIVNYVKLAVLFIPTFLAYPVIFTKVIKDYNITALADFDIIEKSNGAWWTLELVGLFILVPLGIWFYKQVTYKNIDKNWVKRFIQKSSGTRVSKSLTFLKELQDLKQR
jgi:hypothetical protein